MNHDLFGKLKYKDECWLGEATLPVFASSKSPCSSQRFRF